MAVNIVSREQWGAADWTNDPKRVSASERTEFFVHYHGGPVANPYGVRVPQLVQRIHLANGWSGTGYNFMVDQAGVAYEGRGWNLVGAHCPNHNRSGIGVYVAVGGSQEPSAAAKATVRALYEESCSRSGFAQAKRGHRDGKATSCPGELLYAWVRAGLPVPATSPSTPAVQPDPIRPIDEPTLSPVLRRGSEGRHVVALQAALLGLGYTLKSGADGKFGPETEAAVKLLQTTARIKVDGVVGPQTRKVIAAGVRAPQLPTAKPVPPRAEPAVPNFPGTTRRGDGSRDRPHEPTRQFQARLRGRGWAIAVDGSHGPATNAVIRAFQENKKLAVDGVGGPLTWAALWVLPVT